MLRSTLLSTLLLLLLVGCAAAPQPAPAQLENRDETPPIPAVVPRVEVCWPLRRGGGICPINNGWREIMRHQREQGACIRACCEVQRYWCCETEDEIDCRFERPKLAGRR